MSDISNLIDLAEERIKRGKMTEEQRHEFLGLYVDCMNLYGPDSPEVKAIENQIKDPQLIGTMRTAKDLRCNWDKYGLDLDDE